MPSTSVHFPDGVLEEIDRRVRDSGASRNRFIVDACRQALEQGRPSWPPDFFSDAHLTRATLEELHESAAGFELSMRDARTNRQTSPL